MKKKPPFTLTPHIFQLSQQIAHELGVLDGAKLIPAAIKLRRENRIKTIQASLAIEGNTLDIKQVTALLDGKKILGPANDIQEVKNAIEVYSDLTKWKPLSERSILNAHKALLKDLVNTNGQWRTGGVGVFKGKELAHVAPPASRVPKLMQDLFTFIKADKTSPWLIKACVFHYELECIHPFEDGNGRIGRLWQQLLLMKESPVFEFISIEAIIKKNQKHYYDVLSQSDQAGDSTLFLEFSLKTILEALKQYTASSVSIVKDSLSRLAYAEKALGKSWFARKDYVSLQNNLSSATASRDLQKGVEGGMLEKRGDKNSTRYRFMLKPR